MNILIISSPDLIRQRNVHIQFANQTKQVSYELFPAIMMSTARYGIAKSHKACIKLAKDRGWPQVTIVEDDVDFLSPYSLEIYFNTISKLPEDWDIFTGGLFSGEIENNDTTLGYSSVKGSMSGFHLIVVNEKFYDTFLSASETMNIDYEISEILKAKIYVAYPILVSEIPGFSYNSGKNQNYSELLCKKYRCINDCGEPDKL